ncbi:MAG: Sensor protein [Microgenomates group bacterium GW2011_GWC1_37_12b]|uniref:Two component transcriptional regulator, winged helix family n=1 Tax=Candidatus Woesebacteria bacterium GW2011_GWB1_38_8b TaxID=1618571 RepID=A0A0G0PB02_9BACT|nr:MAG: Sensor protein [Microgenomates group bacterium GW2011_GWC1_37_12b]KKQ86476.1 MAG: Two component transcriptional regulator, winged helix family [Candidatus Woesebacteria bacterium GW2011_GWB1_38_8b]
MKRVLIVDDDSDLLKLYKQAFLNASFLVDDVSTIPSAEKLIASKKYDLILLDLLFPSTDTLSTIRFIRNKNTLNSETPILVLTNLETGEKTKKALEYGANECLFKVTQTPGAITKTALRLIGNNHSYTNH